MRLTLYLFCLLNIFNLSPLYSKESTDQHIYLVRHGEKIIGIDDPGLTPTGMKRALWFANYLVGKSIAVIYSTDYKRTRDTAAPLIKLTDKSLTFYDPKNLDDFALKVLADGRNCFISGHSNTTPQLVNFLGGNSGKEMTDEEYVRFYHLLIKSDGQVITEELMSLPAVKN